MFRSIWQKGGTGIGGVGPGETALESKMKHSHHLLRHNSYQGPFKDICVNPHNNSVSKNDDSRLGVRFRPMVTPFAGILGSSVSRGRPLASALESLTLESCLKLEGCSL